MSDQQGLPAVPVAATGRRPKRIWFICGMNVIIGLISFAALVLMVKYLKAASDFGLGPGNIAFSASTSLFLVTASVMVFYRVSGSRWLCLAAATIFLGTMIIQNATLLWGSPELAEALPDSAKRKMFGRVIRSSVELALNYWALFSRKGREYFLAASSHSN